MTDESVLSVDDLRYDWPPNILSYETRFWGGLTLPDMMGAAVPVMLVLSRAQGVGGLVLAVLAGVVGFLVVKKWPGLDNRNLPGYLVARVIHRIQKPRVEMPLIMPRGGRKTKVTVRDWSGNVVARMRGDEEEET